MLKFCMQKLQHSIDWENATQDEIGKAGIKLFAIMNGN